MIRVICFFALLTFSTTLALSAEINSEMSYMLYFPDRDLETGVSILGTVDGTYQVRDYAVLRHGDQEEGVETYDRTYALTAAEYEFLWDLLTGRLPVWNLQGQVRPTTPAVIFSAALEHKGKRVEYQRYDEASLAPGEPFGIYTLFLSSIPGVLASMREEGPARQESFTTTIIYLLPKIGL